MTVQRAQRPKTPLIDPAHRLTSTDHKRETPTRLRMDVPLFDQVLAKSLQEDDGPSNDDRPPSSTPFDLLSMHRAPQETPINVPVFQAVSNILFDVVQQLYATDERSTGRQVSMVLAEDTLPGVVLSVFESEGRLVADFSCGVESSRECLCQIADHLADCLAERLARETRVCVRTDDPEDPCLYQRDGVPPQQGADGINNDAIEKQRSDGTTSSSSSLTAKPATQDTGAAGQGGENA